MRALNLPQQCVARQTKPEDVGLIVLDESGQFAAKLSAVANEPELARAIASRRLQFTIAIDQRKQVCDIAQLIADFFADDLEHQRREHE
jgi:hypothetical protein